MTSIHQILNITRGLGSMYRRRWMLLSWVALGTSSSFFVVEAHNIKILLMLAHKPSGICLTANAESRFDQISGAGSDGRHRDGSACSWRVEVLRRLSTSYPWRRAQGLTTNSKLILHDVFKRYTIQIVGLNLLWGTIMPKINQRIVRGQCFREMVWMYSWMATPLTGPSEHRCLSDDFEFWFSSRPRSVGNCGLLWLLQMILWLHSLDPLCSKWFMIRPRDC